jgi:hypothetical protein
MSRAKAYSRVVQLEIDQSSVVPTTIPSNNPDFSINMEDDDKRPAPPVDFKEDDKFVESNVDNDSLSDVGVDKDDLTKEQVTTLFSGAVVIDDESTSEEVEELEVSVYHAADEIAEPVELDVHKTAILDFLSNAGTSLDMFHKLVFQTS